MLFISLLAGLFGNKGFMISIKSINTCKLCKHTVYLESTVSRLVHSSALYTQLDNLYVKVLNCLILPSKSIHIHYYGSCADI